MILLLTFVFGSFIILAYFGNLKRNIESERRQRMNVLIACEESQAICKEFRKLGHRAFSCDLQECSGGHPEWHIRGDCLPLLNGRCTFTTVDGHTHTQEDRWDLIIAHPPCTDLAVSGAAWFERKRSDGSQRESIEFFCKFLEIDCERVAIENPVGIISGDYVRTYFPDIADKYGLPIKPTQTIHPWEYGDNHEKTTCLWLKGLKTLIPTVDEKPNLEWFEWTDQKGQKKRQPLWYAKAFWLPPKERAKVRSKTFPGIARAMAAQWGNGIRPQYSINAKGQYEFT